MHFENSILTKIAEWHCSLSTWLTFANKKVDRERVNRQALRPNATPTVAKFVHRPAQKLIFYSCFLVFWATKGAVLCSFGSLGSTLLFPENLSFGKGVARSLHNEPLRVRLSLAIPYLNDNVIRGQKQNAFQFQKHLLFAFCKAM